MCQECGCGSGCGCGGCSSGAAGFPRPSLSALEKADLEEYLAELESEIGRVRQDLERRKRPDPAKGRRKEE